MKVMVGGTATREDFYSPNTVDIATARKSVFLQLGSLLQVQMLFLVLVTSEFAGLWVGYK
jgi:hypothetical protein